MTRDHHPDLGDPEENYMLNKIASEAFNQRPVVPRVCCHDEHGVCVYNGVCPCPCHRTDPRDAELERLKGELARAAEERDEERRLHGRSLERSGDYFARMTAAEARAAALEAALRPFAEAWREYDEFMDTHDHTRDGPQRVHIHPRAGSVRYSDFKAAARALARPEEETNV